MSNKAVITCALNGVLTDPKQHHVPLSPKEMAAEARRAYDAGASVVHIHLRQQGEGKGHIASWDAKLSAEVQQAIREACPDIIINHTTGVIGQDDVADALDCIRQNKPEIAACNAGSLNYLKTKSNGSWAWKPILFDNPVDKVQAFLDVMKVSGSLPEFECFDVGIVRCVGMYREAGMYDGPLEYNLVMGVVSGMPTDPDLLPLLLKLIKPDSSWSVGLSESQFRRAFKVSTGFPPYRWQQNLRIAKAQEFLRDGVLPLAQIALATGFVEQSHFSRVFQKTVGVSPGVWQRDHRP